MNVLIIIVTSVGMCIVMIVRCILAGKRNAGSEVSDF
jgi:hypothetical protein